MRQQGGGEIEERGELGYETRGWHGLAWQSLQAMGSEGVGHEAGKERERSYLHGGESQWCVAQI